MPGKRRSITGRVTKSTHMLMIVLTAPVLLSLIVMLLYAMRYRTTVSRMEAVAQLKPVVTEDITGELWSAVSGMRSFEVCGVYDTIETVNGTLEKQIESTEQSGPLSLIVARRTMDTLTDYVRRIEESIDTGAPVAESEALLEEVRNVASLVSSMLEEYITGEVEETARTTSVLHVIVLATALAEILMLVLAVVISRTMLKHTAHVIREPIEHMEHFAALLAEGTLSARIPETDVEELRTLAESYNTMADRLENLIAQNEQKQENLKKSELRLLQAQINPHFLYNTLDAIVWQAESGNNDEVVSLIRALSDFYRISLSSGADWIPVSQEMKHLNGYLSIQQTRYRDILHTRIEIDSGIGEVVMLKLLLQPLVENAIYHGIKNKRGGGTITIIGKREADMLFFSVSDTGAGMTESQLDAVRARLREERGSAFVSEGTKGYGLSNVDQRIRLYYKQQEGLNVESGPEGTTVSFRVPCRSKGEFET